MFARAMLALVFVCFSALVTSTFATPTNWTDCMPDSNSSKVLFFDSLVSTNPVHYGQQQVINKTFHATRLVTNVTIDFQQFWKVPVVGKWFRFIRIKRKGCDEHPQFCPLAKGTSHVTTIHPPLAKLTPFGMYRSLQHYYDANTGVMIGCVDMLVPYVKA